MLKKLLGAPRDLLLRSFDGVLGGDDWRPLLDFVSPTFFDVVPLRTLLSQGRELVGNAANGQERTRTEGEIAGAISSRGLAVQLAPTSGSAPVSPDRVSAELRGQRVLELYFVQLFGAGASLIDLRHGSFAETGDALSWSPGPYFLRWDGEFLAALRTLYEGYYGEDEPAFDAGLEALQLAGSKDLFREHFGTDPGSVRFDRAHFVSTFHDVFVRCREQGVSLHPNFLPLGIYLACLHDHLGALGGGPFDVRAAFERARGAPTG